MDSQFISRQTNGLPTQPGLSLHNMSEQPRGGAAGLGPGAASGEGASGATQQQQQQGQGQDMLMAARNSNDSMSLQQLFTKYSTPADMGEGGDDWRAGRAEWGRGTQRITKR